MNTKKEIRKRMLEVRSSLSAQDVEAKSAAIVQKVLNTPEFIEADNILLYADFGNEVMTRGIFENAILAKKRAYFPKCDRLTNRMDFYRIISVNQLKPGFKGIMEPEEAVEKRFVMNGAEDTLAIVPGVAFDISGYRIGYGRGYYDRFLAERRQISTMALAYSCQIVDEIYAQEHDIKMDKIVTEEIIYSFLRI